MFSFTQWHTTRKREASFKTGVLGSLSVVTGNMKLVNRNQLWFLQRSWNERMATTSWKRKLRLSYNKGENVSIKKIKEKVC